MTDSTIIYTHTDEAPALATLLPAPRSCRPSPRGRVVVVETRDISLAGTHPRLVPGASATRPAGRGRPRRVGRSDVLTPEANIIKLPNICASLPQLKAAIAELQAKGFEVPDYPDDPHDRRGARRPSPLRRRQGQRRQPGAAPGQLRPPRPGVGQGTTPDRHPHSMGVWSRDSRTQRRPRWSAGDFRATERSATVAAHRQRPDRARRRRRQRDGPQASARSRSSPARSSTPP